MYEYYSAVLHAVREGLLLLDDRRPGPAGQRRGPAAARPARRRGRPPVDELGLPPGLVAAALGRTAEADDIYVAGEHVLVVSSAPAALAGPRRRRRGQPARPHRAAVGHRRARRGPRPHRVAALAEPRGRQPAAHRGVPDRDGPPGGGGRVRDRGARGGPALTDRVVGAVGDPVVAALLLGKRPRPPSAASTSPSRATCPTSATPWPRATWSPCSATWSTTPSTRWPAGRTGGSTVRLGGDLTRSAIVVGDSGPGLTAEQAGPRARAGLDHQGLGRRPRGRGVGLALVGQVARRHGGDVDIGTSAARRRGVHRDAATRAGPGERWTGMTVRVLVVEDEALAAEAHAAYTARVAGLRGRRRRPVGRRGGPVPRPQDRHVDLILLDMHLPDGHGLGLLQRLRAAGHLCDVIAVTSARDADVVRHAVAQGVVLYLLKPFTFATFRAKLEQYAAYRAQLAAAPTRWSRTRSTSCSARCGHAPAATLPKGMSAETLREVTRRCATPARRCPRPRSPQAVGASRVTARRYLEHLADDRPGRAAPAVRRQRPPRGGVPLALTAELRLELETRVERVLVEHLGRGVLDLVGHAVGQDVRRLRRRRRPWWCRAGCCESTWTISSATLSNSSWPKPRVVSAGVPSRMPEVYQAPLGSCGHRVAVGDDAGVEQRRLGLAAGEAERRRRRAARCGCRCRR